MPVSPDIGRPNDRPATGKRGLARESFGDDFALTIDGLGKVVRVANREATGRTDKLRGRDDAALDRRRGSNRRQHVGGSFRVHAITGLDGRVLIAFRARGQVQDVIRLEFRERGPRALGIENIVPPPKRFLGRVERRIERVIQQHVVALGEKIDNIGPDEAGPASHEQPHERVRKGAAFFISALKPKFVIAGQVPPPFGGQNIMIQEAFAHFSRSPGRVAVHLPFHFTPDVRQARAGSLGKLLELVRVVVRLLRVRAAGLIDRTSYIAGIPVAGVLTRRRWYRVSRS